MIIIGWLVGLLLLGAAVFLFWPLGEKIHIVNLPATPRETILAQMNEPRPLPMGQKEFDEWAARIISGALIPTDDMDSLRFVLSAMILALGDTESHKPDAYFIHKLRKAAANEVANANAQAIKAKKTAEALAEQKEAQAVQTLSEVKTITDARVSNLIPK